MSTTAKRRAAARANQQAAAFVRFHMISDHEAMHVVLREVSSDPTAMIGFVTALASLAGNAAASSMGREGALAHFGSVARNSALLEASDDIDRFFDNP
jgi:hypothetical protein